MAAGTTLQTSAPAQQLLRLKPASEFIGYSVRTLGNSGWRQRRGLRAYKRGRHLLFHPADLERLIEREPAANGVSA
jgi:hypothetical protein